MATKVINKIRKIFIFSDLSEGQVNGVKTTYKNAIEILESRGLEITFVTLDDISPWLKIPLSKQESIFWGAGGVEKAVKSFLEDHDFNPKTTAISIATEGAVGKAVKKLCKHKSYHFTTVYHTQYPEYLAARFGLGIQRLELVVENLAYWHLRRFHQPADKILTRSCDMKTKLQCKGIGQQVEVWSAGFNDTFFTIPKPGFNHLHFLATQGITILKDEVILLYVGRIAPEKNITDLLNLQAERFDGKRAKIICVGSGSTLSKLKQKYVSSGQVFFVGAKQGQELLNFYQSADVLVFPSTTDTFGLVLLEALGCGTVCAAYQSQPGPEVINKGLTRPLVATSTNLKEAIEQALAISSKTIRDMRPELVAKFSRQQSVQSFLDGMVTMG